MVTLGKVCISYLFQSSDLKKDHSSMTFVNGIVTGYSISRTHKIFISHLKSDENVVLWRGSQS